MTVGVRGDAARQPDTKQMMARAVEQQIVPKPQDSLVRRLAVRLDRMLRRGLVKRQTEIPFAVPAIGEIVMPHHDQRATPEEVWIREFEIEVAAVGVFAVRDRDLSRRTEKIALHETDFPGLIACDRREARLRLRAPTVRVHRAQREPAVGQAHRIHAHLAKHAEVPQQPLTFFHARKVERIAAIEQQSPPDHPLPRPHVQPVGHIRDPIG